MREVPMESGLTGPEEGPEAQEETTAREVTLADILKMQEGIFEVQMAQLVVLQRIYDLLLADMNIKHSGVADYIHDEHEAGRIKGPAIKWDATDE